MNIYIAYEVLNLCINAINAQCAFVGIDPDEPFLIGFNQFALIIPREYVLVALVVAIAVVGIIHMRRRNMVVYTLEINWYAYDEFQLVGVYSTHEKAEQAWERLRGASDNFPDAMYVITETEVE